MKKLKEKLNAKLSKNGGFTLIEMLIVVAIIAILIAVSIPLVSSSLETARDTTDDANYRSAAAVGEVLYLNEQAAGRNADGTYWYCISSANKTGGMLVKEEDISGKTLYQAKCTAADAAASANGHGETGAYKDANIQVIIDSTATNPEEIIKVNWAKK